jgi:hypothetical protein
MKKAILSAVLILIFAACMSQSKEKNQSKTMIEPGILHKAGDPIGDSKPMKKFEILTKQEMAAKLSADYEAYSKEVIADSTLQVYWTYTGQEKREIKMDSTIVKGKVFRTMTIVPTQQFVWLKKTPNYPEFELWLKNKESKKP